MVGSRKVRLVMTCGACPEQYDADYPDCPSCDNSADDVESTYCGSMCGECRSEHAEECEVCRQDFEDRFGLSPKEDNE